MLIFCGTHVEQQLLLLWRFTQHLPNHTKLSRITSSKPCKHAASITESPSQDRLLLIRQFLLQRLTGPHSLQNALWLLPSPSQNFRGTFAIIPPSADPSHQQGAHQRNRKHQALGVWLSQSLTFGSLAAAFRGFLETSESNIRQYERQVFGCGDASPSEAWLLPMKGKVNVVYHSPAGAWAAGGGSP